MQVLARLNSWKRQKRNVQLKKTFIVLIQVKIWSPDACASFKCIKKAGCVHLHNVKHFQITRILFQCHSQPRPPFFWLLLAAPLGEIGSWAGINHRRSSLSLSTHDKEKSNCKACECARSQLNQDLNSDSIFFLWMEFDLLFWFTILTYYFNSSFVMM